MVCIPCRLYMAGFHGCCRECGGPVVSAPRNWSPPKRTNERAWKRVEKGEWAWDRRRVRRGYYQGFTWFSPPTHKKGQRKVYQRGVRRVNGADVDMGG